MRRRVLEVVVVAAGLVGGFDVAAKAAQGATPVRSQQVALIGCVTQAPDGAFQLTNVTPASVPARSTGSNSAKASTPIVTSAVAVDRPRTRGTTTAKGSTPINFTSVSLSSSPTYALDARRSNVASHAGYTVEVTGALKQQRVLQVETLRPLAANCAH